LSSNIFNFTETNYFPQLCQFVSYYKPSERWPFERASSGSRVR